jgi:FHA domain
MGKLVIKYKGKLVDEVNLKLGETKIGRKAGSDIVLNDASVSGEHAIIKTVGLRSTINDLESTNGTFIENKRVMQHELRHGETIMIGAHTLLYRDDANLDAPMHGRHADNGMADDSQEKTKILTAFAQLLAVDGTDKGKRLPLIKDEVTLDNPGKSPARIIRGPDGYVVHASAGPGEPRLNDRPIPPGGRFLENGDMLEVGGTKFRFFK